MGDRFAYRWLMGLLMVAMLAAVGVYTYNLGVAHGIAESAQAVAAPNAGAPGVPAVPVVPYWAYGPRPWGYGFGFFPFFPFLFILFWVFVLRGIFWRGRWHHRDYWYGGGVPPAFDEWHRRAHAQQNPPTPGTSS